MYISLCFMNNEVSITAKQTTTESCTAVTVTKFTNMMVHSIFQNKEYTYLHDTQMSQFNKEKVEVTVYENTCTQATYQCLSNPQEKEYKVACRHYS